MKVIKTILYLCFIAAPPVMALAIDFPDKLAWLLFVMCFPPMLVSYEAEHNKRYDGKLLTPYLASCAIETSVAAGIVAFLPKHSAFVLALAKIAAILWAMTYISHIMEKTKFLD